jgi:hypothetical protein
MPSVELVLLMCCLLSPTVVVDAAAFKHGTVGCNTQSNVCAYSNGFNVNVNVSINCDDGVTKDNCATKDTEGYAVQLVLVEGLEQGQDSASDCPKKKGCETGEKVTVRWDTSDLTCTRVDTGEGRCASCTTCSITGDPGSPDFVATFSSDCSNLVSTVYFACSRHEVHCVVSGPFVCGIRIVSHFLSYCACSCPTSPEEES